MRVGAARRGRGALAVLVALSGLAAPAASEPAEQAPPDPVQEAPPDAAGPAAPDPVQQAIEEERWDEAIAAARAQLETSPEDAAARTRLALALYGKSRSEHQTLDTARLDRVKDATDPMAFFDPALFRTEVDYEKTLLEQAEVEFRRALAAEAPPLDAYIGLARIYVETERFGDEIEVLAAGARRFPGDLDAMARLLSFGEHHFRASQYDEALQVFHTLETMSPGHPSLALDTAAALFASGRYDEGIATLERTMAVHPADGNMYRTLGQMYLFRKEWKKAAATFQELRSFEPDDRMTVVYHGAALMPVDPKASAATFESLLDAEGAPRDQTWAVARNLHTAVTSTDIPAEELIGLASDLTRLSMPQLAITICGLVLHREPQSFRARLMTAVIYDRMSYDDLALAELEKAGGLLDASPGGGDPAAREQLHIELGRVYFHQGNHRKAIEEFLAAGNTDRFSLALALSYESLGDRARAFEQFQRVLATGTESQQEEAREHLAREEYSAFRETP